MELRERPLTIAIMALGGQGGGVLTKWLVEVAQENNYLAQSTYIAGVAQRTGSTVYCVEMFPQARVTETKKEPIFTPTPIPGDVDLVIAGEMAETGRAIQRGFVTPNITTLIASSHRVYSVTEKSALGDGIVDLTRMAEIADKVSKRFVSFDMQSIADETGSVISSVLLGAIAGSGVLPFERESFEVAIRQSGRAVQANLKGFASGFAAMVGDGVHPFNVTTQATDTPDAVATGANAKSLEARVRAELPPRAQNLALHGALRALDYQDLAYAKAYLDLLSRIHLADAEEGGEQHEFELTEEVARQLALQMCYEDTIRVADLKTRPQRIDRIREHVAADADQPVNVYEYFHPRIEEVCDTLPKSIGAFVLRSKWLHKLLSPFFSKGYTVPTTSIGGYLMLHTLAKFRRFRRGTYRYRRQKAHIEDWLQRIHDALEEDYGLAKSIANCVEIVKGYGDTYERGLSRYQATMNAISNQSHEGRAATVRALHQAALADEKGQVFSEALARLSPAP